MGPILLVVEVVCSSEDKVGRDQEGCPLVELIMLLGGESEDPDVPVHLLVHGFERNLLEHIISAEGFVL